mmetsp:Transcript_5667/g.8218  ORF Transcript_5667/g.8218 Transcript_5667/m.8218 type:complete len:445 (-) Transcript_5667:17-1351(-)
MKKPKEKSMLAFVVGDCKDEDSNNIKDENDNVITNGKVMRVPIPKVMKEYALIRVLYAGVCNTDLEILKGYMGFQGVLGHEFVGVVESLHTDDPNLRSKFLSKRVCGDINLACGGNKNSHQNNNTDNSHDTNNNQHVHCPTCTNHNSHHPNLARNHCPFRTVLGILNHDGTMANYLTLPIRNLHLVPDNVSDQDAVFAEPLAAAYRILEQNLIHIHNNGNYHNHDNTTNHHDHEYDNKKSTMDKVAILGDGKLGLMIAEVIGRYYTAHIHSQQQSQQSQTHTYNNNNKPILFGKHPHKMNLVQNSGVQCHPVTTCQLSQTNTDQASPQHADQYDVVIDATGNPHGLSLAASLCKPMGTLVLKSTCAVSQADGGFNAAPFVIKELNVVGSRCGPIDKALNLISKNQDSISVSKYVTQIFTLDKAQEALHFAAQRSTMKVLIDCST